MNADLQKVFEAYKCVIETEHENLEATYTLFEEVARGEKQIGQLMNDLHSVGLDIVNLKNILDKSFDMTIDQIMENCEQRRNLVK